MVEFDWRNSIQTSHWVAIWAEFLWFSCHKKGLSFIV